MLKQPIYVEFNLDAKVNNSKLIAISHVDDKYSETLEVAVKQNDRFVYMGGASVVARMVLHREKDYLLSDSVPCDVNDNGNILIPFDNAVVKTLQGTVKIEVSISRDEDRLTLQFPLWVSVTGSILDNAEVTPESQGTIPELLKEVKEELARVEGYVDEEQVKQIIDGVLSGVTTNMPTLLIDSTVDQQYNPDGHLLWYYIDSDGTRNNLFDFTPYIGAAAANEIYIGDTEPSDSGVVLWIDTSSGGEPIPETTDPVTNLAGTATANSVTIGWQPSSNAASYKIYQGDVLIDSVTGTSYTINDLMADTSYTFGVVASGVGGDSPKVTLIIQTQQGGDLPVEYQQVEYVQPAGVANQINTGIQNADISKIEMGLFNDYSKYMKITGACDTADTWASGSGRPYIYKFEGDTPLRQVGYNTMTIDSAPSQYGGLSVYVDFVFSDITPNSSEVDVSDYFTFGNDINSGANTNVARYYYVKIYNSDNDVIADYVPCYRFSDGKVGMYDLVRKRFYTPVNGEFIKGGDV